MRFAFLIAAASAVTLQNTDHTAAGKMMLLWCAGGGSSMSKAQFDACLPMLSAPEEMAKPGFHAKADGNFKKACGTSCTAAEAGVLSASMDTG